VEIPNNVNASLNYIGSKVRLLPFLHSVMSIYIKDFSPLSIADPFAGSGAVVRSFRGKVNSIIANDFEYYSYVLNRAALIPTTPASIWEKLSRLNELLGRRGFIFEEYSEGGKAGRLYFSRENGQKIDAIRQELELWREEKSFSETDYFILLAALLEAADKVANVASVYGAFLKKIKNSAQKSLRLTATKLSPVNTQMTVFQKDAQELVREISGDILYLDPPYNARQYGANYHLLNTIASYKAFTPSGITGLPRYQRSNWCRRQKVEAVFEELIATAQFSYIFLSYNNEGLLPPKKIQSIMEKYGRYTVHSQKYQRFKADKNEARNHKATATEEFLHVLVKN